MTLSDVARANGKTPFAAAKVKTVPIPAVQAFLASAIGETPETIWPSRYKADGTPVSRIIWLAKHSTKQRRGHVQKREAA